MKAWKRLDETTVTKVGWRTVVHKQFLTNRGVVVKADVVSPEGSAAAGTIALTKDGQVIVARQFRAGPELVLDEIPGGAVDPGELPEAAAKRELLEEVGYVAGNMHYLGKAYKDAWNNAEWHYFLATDCVPQADGQHLDDYEDIEVKLIPIDEFLHNAKHAKMTDVHAVLLAYEKLQELNRG